MYPYCLSAIAIPSLVVLATPSLWVALVGGLMYHLNLRNVDANSIFPKWLLKLSFRFFHKFSSNVIVRHHTMMWCDSGVSTVGVIVVIGTV